MSAPSLHLRPRAVTRFTALVVCLCLSLSLAAGIAVAKPMPAPTRDVPVDAYEVDNVQAQAKTITVGAVPQEHTIHARLNNDWVKFPAKAGSTYVIDNPDYFSMRAGIKLQLEEYSGMRVVFELCDSAGKVIARSQNADNRRFTLADKRLRLMSEQIVWKAPKSQTVYVRISSFPDMEYEQVGSYLVQVKSVVPQITGNVTTPDGEPAQFAYVSTRSGIADAAGRTTISYESRSGATALTDENGDYVLHGLDDGDYSVFFDGIYWQNSYLQDEFYDDVHRSDSEAPKVLTVGGMKRITGIDAQLDLASGFISGRVVNEAGKPIQGIRVEPYYQSGSSWYTWSSDFFAWTDADGYYVCRGGTDTTWRIGFFDDTGMSRYFPEYWDDASSLDTASNIVVSGGSAPGSYDATLTSIPLLASGTIEDSAGVGIPDGWVDVYDSETSGYMGSVSTDEDGYWEYHATAGFDAIFLIGDGDNHFRPEYYDNATDYGSAKPQRLAVDEPVVADAVLVPYEPSLSGVVTDAKTGAPARGIQVWLFDYTGISWFPIDSAVTDAAGAYVFQQIWGDEFIVKYYDPTGYFATEYCDNVASPFKAEWFYADLGADIKLDAALQAQGDRVYGRNRFGTAVAAGKQAFPEWDGINDVIIASGDDAAACDPLVAGSLSWAYDAPLLLTSKNASPRETIRAIKQIETASGGELVIHVVGGPSAIPAARIAEMASIVGTDSIERLPYGNRYETARQVALRSHEVALERGEDPGVVFLVNGSDPAKFWDALSASAIAARIGAPILLTPTTGAVPGPTMMALEEIAPDDVYVVGGTACVPASGYAAVKATARLAGRNRYETSVKLAKFGGAEGWLSYTRIGLAASLPDGLTGGSALGLLGGPMLVTRGSSLPTVTYRFIDNNDQLIDHALIFGGANSVSGAVTASVKQALKQ